jgi:drug/metabolite transporter (DMT)-like permease
VAVTRSTGINAGLGFGALAAAGWGISLAAARHGVAMGLSVSDLAFIRYATAGPLLAVFLIVRHHNDWRARLSLSKIFVLVLLAGPPLTICVLGGDRLAPFASGVLVEKAALAVGCIVLARLRLGERLDAARWVALCLLGTRIFLIAGSNLLSGSTQVQLGILLFAASSCMSAAFAAFVCRWKIAPLSAMAVVSISSLLTFGPYYLATDGGEHLMASSSGLLFEEIVCQGLIAGIAAWIGFIYSARLLGLVTATFLPAITPAIAVTIGLVFMGELPTLSQWSMIAFSSVGALLLVIRTGSIRNALCARLPFFRATGRATIRK